MGIVFVGFEKGAPAVVGLSFIIDDLNAPDLNVSVKQHSCPGDCVKGYDAYFVPQDLRAQFETRHPDYAIGDGATVAHSAETFVNLAIGEQPLDIGPPIAVLIVDSLRTQWLKSGACAP